jgi:TetR/AcrR family transcriptional repressor for divergent bdcA
MGRTGRPREFDVQNVLDKALPLFWEQGYESTTLAQLRGAMGLSSASFYAAFDSKESLFEAVVQRYADSFGRVTDTLADDSLDPRLALEMTLRDSVRMQTDASHPLGCLIMLACNACGPDGEGSRRLLSARRAHDRDNIARCVARAVEAGQLTSDTSVDAIATMFHSFLLGISTQARDGIPAAILDASVTEIMSIWDSLSTV